MGLIKDIFDMIMEMIHGDISNREAFFKNHVEPLYENLIIIHKDYINGFQDIRAKLKDGSFTNEELILFIRDRRLEYEPERQLVKSLANELGDTEQKRFSGAIGYLIKDYCQAICDYFSEVGFVVDYSLRDRNLKLLSAFTCIIELLKAKREVPEDIKNKVSENIKKEVPVHINLIMENVLPKAFNKVTHAYAKLKVILI